MNITKEQADKVIAALETTYFREIDIPAREQALSIMRGLEDAAPVCNHEWFQTGAMLSNEKRCIQCGEWGKLYTSPQAAQTEADELLRKWNLDPDLYRTDSGALNHMKIAAALKHPDDYPHTAQTAVKSESLAQAAQALAQPPSEGKTIEALAPTEAALRDVVRQSEDMGLYDADFQTGRAGSKP